MKRVFVGFLVISFSLLIKSCDTTDPPDNKTLTLKLEDVSCTEVWIELTTTNLQLPATLILKQTNPTGDTKSQILNINTKDSLLYIDSLLPNQSYTFIASHSGLSGISSNALSVTTMDTTSHNFTWQVFSFGEHSHSRLNDVTIIDENNIWAVGEIYLNDSIGQSDPEPYAVAHWDGTDWMLMKVYYHDYGTTQKFPGKLKTIFSFGTDNIYVCSSANLLKWENGSWNEKAFFMISVPFDGQVNKIWGLSENDIFCAGNSGAIYHYTGEQTWQQLESGTDVDLKDIWGIQDGTVWACGYSGDYAISALLKISGQQLEKIYEGFSGNQSNGYYIGPISGVWGKGHIRFYLMNWSGMYIQANSSNLFLEKEIVKFSDVGFGIDGTDDNNIFTCGEGFVGHWNGTSYTEYPGLYKSSRTFLNVNVKGNTIAAVGSDYNSFIYSQAVIALSK